jgi:putative PIN family toxin of toxin-antitoxin system
MLSRQSPYFALWRAFDEGKYFLCVSNEIIQEYQEIIGVKANEFVAENVVDFIMNSPYCLKYDPQYNFHLIEQDPDDNKFVDCAIVANADYIVSEDSHFRVLSDIPFPKVNVILLDDFMCDILRL